MALAPAEKYTDWEDITVSRNETNTSALSNVFAKYKDNICFVSARFTLKNITANIWTNIGSINKHFPMQNIPYIVYDLGGQIVNNAIVILDTSGNIQIRATSALSAGLIINTTFTYVTTA